MQTCTQCGSAFAMYPVVDGKRVDLRGRQRCLECRPHRPLRRPRLGVPRPPRQQTCASCGRQFPAKTVIGGRVRSLYQRTFCLTCSPFGIHNTSKFPPGVTTPTELHERRRRGRNAKTYRYQKKRRKVLKAEMVASRGGRCEACGYDTASAALEFHHRDATSKEFGIGKFTGSRARLLAEAAKCDLLCANCHRRRHAALETATPLAPVVAHRRKRKLRAIAYMGSTCHACGRDGPPALFEFHHWNAAEKDFGLSESGIPRSWKKVAAELAKCVMLCANCHREVHAGVRDLDEGLLGLAEDALVSAA